MNQGATMTCTNAITIRDATMDDYDIVFGFIEKLWTYNTYDKSAIRKVYQEVLESTETFAFLLFENAKAVGFCHGAYINTFWLSGKTCYLSSIITLEEERRKGHGATMMNHAKELAVSQGCKGIILDSGMQRTDAHAFYEHYGFSRSAYCFELKL